MPDITQYLVDQIKTAIEDGTQLNIIGGNSKSFYGREPVGEAMFVHAHRGILSYEPSELVMTARAGTSLEEIEATLKSNHQMLPFEPPHYGPNATIGGTIACNLSGPRRAYAGAARDFVLGSKVINGKGEVLQFGGEVMKNVAGYDVSRLMTGAMGTLGVLLEVSFKVLPLPKRETTLKQAIDATHAITRMNQLAAKPLPLSATAYLDGQLYVRLSGSESALEAAAQQVGGDVVPDAQVFWTQLREHRLPMFKHAPTVWRLSVPQTTELLPLTGHSLMEWGGGLRWLVSDETADRIRTLAADVGGHAVIFKSSDREQAIFHPLGQGLMNLHKNIKQAFDPHKIFNAGRLYAEY